MATRSHRAQKAKTSKSSLVSHTFPPFYACYLLKSIRSPKSTATYIGSTPHPPRRIRQHNGEITQGAWKTSRNRPWVMNMIVHGFPSKLAALQFEWAWQHPNLSRHLKSGEMAKGRTLKGNIAVARSMLATHPYTTWPLHVKLFTPEAVKGWMEACKDPNPLPPGFTFCTELEGVDGKRDDLGSGRKGPIDVTDRPFTLEHLAKHTAALSTGMPQRCSICASDLDFHKADPLSLALCPTSNCTSYSHLICLANHFLGQCSAASSSEPSMIPRGGNCDTCHKYILWGDVVRGCFRRRTGRHGAAIEQSAIVEEAEQESDNNTGEIFGDDLEEPPKVSPQKRKAGTAKATVTMARTKGKKSRRQVVPLEEEGEFFDLDAITSSDSASSRSVHGPPATTKAKSTPRPRGRPPGSKSDVKTRCQVVPQEEEGEILDLSAISSSDSTVSHSTRRRLATKKATSPPRPRGRPTASKSPPKQATKFQMVKPVFGDFFDIDEFSSSDDDIPHPRKPRLNSRPPGGLASPMAAMSIHHPLDDDIPMGISSSPTRTVQKQTSARRLGDEMDSVIEISD